MTDFAAATTIAELLEGASAGGARELFVERQAVRAGSDADGAALPQDRLSGLSLARLMAGGLAQGPGPHSSVVPIGAVRLYREMRMTGSLAGSLAARAASSAGQLRRSLDGTLVEFVIEEDAAYIVITPTAAVASKPPTVLELLGEDGALVRLPLPPPNNGVIQTALRVGATGASEAVRLMAESATSIFLL